MITINTYILQKEDLISNRQATSFYQEFTIPANDGIIINITYALHSGMRIAWMGDEDFTVYATIQHVIDSEDTLWQELEDGDIAHECTTALKFVATNNSVALTLRIVLGQGG